MVTFDPEKTPDEPEAHGNSLVRSGARQGEAEGAPVEEAPRWARILAIRAALQDGSYQVDAKVLADLLIDGPMYAAAKGVARYSGEEAAGIQRREANDPEQGISTETRDEAIMSETLELTARDGQKLSAFVSRPEGAAKGGLVVIQEIFGVNAHIRSVVEGFAKEGYVAIAPAFFDRIEPGVELKYEGEDLQKAFGLYQKLDPATAILDVAAAFAHIQGEGAGTGVVGFCYGGLMSWLSATRGPAHGVQPKCTVGYYAGGIGSVASEQPSCPVLLHFGAKDTHIGVEQIDAVRGAHPEVQIYVYEDAEHGFNCDARGSFNPEAAALARKRTLAFFQQHIG